MYGFSRRKKAIYHHHCFLLTGNCPEDAQLHSFSSSDFSLASNRIPLLPLHLIHKIKVAAVVAPLRYLFFRVSVELAVANASSK